ncbi:Card1-like endonuclease domain-containing protein [Desulfolutivibrio sulfoxidireducens]|uniref:Card1-like endonuclease domain-containing protein n=1 Tax=Desulfolutivibrio sulfoxidireducens TaxID=2773299 RepID=UPI00159D5029|nr:DUF1887 family CARF protein [Desulfolutivibrio sulfoxidireducens]QLA19341.1 DUF1887 family protein [Desulfolutivibrio sulfoxidireducens]
MDHPVTTPDWPESALRDRAHVCLVSGQSLPNLMPLLWDRARPRELILCATRDMTANVPVLERFAAKRGIAVSRRDLPGTDPMAVGQALRDLVDSRPPNSLAVNLTGGTKLMALGALEAARAADLPTFYMDTDRGKCLLLSAPAFQEEPLPELCRVADILEAHGYAVLSSDIAPVPAAIRKLTLTLIDGFDRFAKAISVFNAMAQEAARTPGHALPRRDWPAYKAFQDLLGLFRDVGTLSLDRDTVRFATEEDCFFAGGGWLEAHVKAILHRLRADGRIHDHAANVVAENAKGVRNELDAALVARNRLFVVECKTARMSGEEGRDEDVSYKLDTLRDVLGGIMTRAMLVSYLHLSPARRKRCREYRIRVIEGPELQHLEEKIKQWTNRT